MLNKFILHCVQSYHKRQMRRVSYQVIWGRLKDKSHPEKGRMLKKDIATMLEKVFQRLDEILPVAELDKLPDLGSRHNVFLTAMTIAGYQAYKEAGFDHDYAIELVADIGWKIYYRFLTIPRILARLYSKNPQRQIHFILHALMAWPFGKTVRPGYELKHWGNADGFYTHWSFCPPYQFVEKYIEKHGDHGEMEAFYKSWCGYDWAFTSAMIQGHDSHHGHFERSSTIALGDEDCIMRWYAKENEETFIK